MSNKVKGLLKGLRYISQIFEEEEEPEMQIGCPTDVKHVAHIGWDGPTANSPSWIQKFKDGEGPPNGDQQNASQAQAQARELKPPAGQERRVSTGSDNPGLEPSPSRRRSTKEKSTRRHSSAASTSSASNNNTNNGSDSPKRSSEAKTSRRRKSKTSSSKSKNTSTLSDVAYSDPNICSEVDQNGLDDKAARRIRAM